MTTVEDITSSQWSCSLQDVGYIVTDLEDIKQCLYIIISTRKGTTPYMEDFGCGIFDWLDKPMTESIPNISRDIKQAIAAYEPRAIVQSVEATGDAEGRILVSVYWQPVEGTRYGSLQSTEFAIFRGIVYLVNENNDPFSTELGTLVF